MSISTPLNNHKQLLQRVAKGDEYAFRILYDEFSPKIYVFALSILKDTLSAEEVMQETMLKVWKLGEKLMEIDYLNAYIKTISRNYCYNLLRRQQIEQRSKSELLRDWKEGHDETEDLLLLKEAKAILQQAVDALPAYHKKVYELCYQEGLKYDEVAEKLQLSPHTVKTYMKHSLRSIREYLSQHSDMAVFLIILKLF